MNSIFKFAEGEKVLCFHGPLLYEAKVLKSQITKDKAVRYYIHYVGWSKNWDEYVPENRVLKFNDANVQRQKQVAKLHQTGKPKKSASKGKKADTGATQGKDGAISSGGSESRASTSSKEVNTSTLVAPSTSRARGKQNQVGQTGAGGDASKKEDGKEDSNSKDDKDEQAKKKRTSTAVANTNDKISTNATNATTATAVNHVSSTPIASAPKENRLEPFVESEDAFLTKLELKIKIPDELKQRLSDDWYALTRQHKLIEIPARYTMQHIVDQYMIFKKSSKSMNTLEEVAHPPLEDPPLEDPTLEDVLNGIIEYFNVMLGCQLLYKIERPQYADVLQQFPDTPPSKLYGGFHLLRLFTKLGPMLALSSLDEKSKQITVNHLHDFLKYLDNNIGTYLSMSNFVNVTPEYYRTAIEQAN